MRDLPQLTSCSADRVNNYLQKFSEIFWGCDPGERDRTPKLPIAPGRFSPTAFEYHDPARSTNTLPTDKALPCRAEDR